MSWALGLLGSAAASLRPQGCPAEACPSVRCTGTPGLPPSPGSWAVWPAQITDCWAGSCPSALTMGPGVQDTHVPAHHACPMPAAHMDVAGSCLRSGTSSVLGPRPPASCPVWPLTYSRQSWSLESATPLISTALALPRTSKRTYGLGAAGSIWYFS